YLVKLEFRDYTNCSRANLQANLKYIGETGGPCQIVRILKHVWSNKKPVQKKDPRGRGRRTASFFFSTARISPGLHSRRATASRRAPHTSSRGGRDKRA